MKVGSRILIVLLTILVLPLGNLTAENSVRIISLTNSVVELLYEIGEEDHLVARADYTIYPEAATALPSFAGSANPSVEALLSFRPDLVLSPTMISTDSFSQVLEKFAIKTVVMPDQSIADFTESAKLLGKLIDQPAKIEAYLDRFHHSLETIATQTAQQPRATAILLYSTTLPYSASAGTWVDELLRITNFTNLVDTPSKWPQLKMEYLLSADPEWLLFAPSSPESALRMREEIQQYTTHPIWKKLSAVKQNKIAILPPSLFHIPGPRMIEAAQALSKIRDN